MEKFSDDKKLSHKQAEDESKVTMINESGVNLMHLWNGTKCW